MQIVRSGDLLPGQHFTEAEMARQIGASTVSVREFLIGFSRYGLVQKAANGIQQIIGRLHRYVGVPWHGIVRVHLEKISLNGSCLFINNAPKSGCI